MLSGRVYYQQYTTGGKKIPLVVAVLQSGERIYDRAMEWNVLRLREWLTAMRLPSVQYKGESEDTTCGKPWVVGRILLVVGVLWRGEQMFDRVVKPNVPRLREQATAMRCPGVQHEGVQKQDATHSKPWVHGSGWAPTTIAELARCESDRCPEASAINQWPTMVRYEGAWVESKDATHSKPQVVVSYFPMLNTREYYLTWSCQVLWDLEICGINYWCQHQPNWYQLMMSAALLW